jgi:hypothetical protein
MKPEGSLPHAQDPATRRYLQPDQSMPPTTKDKNDLCLK